MNIDKHSFSLMEKKLLTLIHIMDSLDIEHLYQINIDEIHKKLKPSHPTKTFLSLGAFNFGLTACGVRARILVQPEYQAKADFSGCPRAHASTLLRASGPLILA